MILICECCNHTIEHTADIKVMHKNGCEPETFKVSKSAPDTGCPQIKILPDGRMDVKNAALYIGCHRGTLDNWRVTGDGPRFHKVAKKVYYKKAELDLWIAAKESRTTAQSRLKSQL